MIRRALRYMYPEEDRWVLIAASVACSAAMAIAVYAPQASAEVGPSQRPDRVVCGSPNVVVSPSECEAYMLEDADADAELPRTS